MVAQRGRAERGEAGGESRPARAPKGARALAGRAGQGEEREGAARTGAAAGARGDRAGDRIARRHPRRARDRHLALRRVAAAAPHVAGCARRQRRAVRAAAARPGLDARAEGVGRAGCSGALGASAMELRGGGGGAGGARRAGGEKEEEAAAEGGHEENKVEAPDGDSV